MILEDRLGVLGRVAESWLDASNPYREEAVRSLSVSTGLSEFSVQMALTWAFEELTTEKLTTFWNEEKLSEKIGSALRVLVLLPGNVFTSWLPTAVTALLLGHKCFLKPSTQEPIMPRVWRQSVERVNPDLAKEIEIVPWRDALYYQTDAMIVYGSDTTIDYLKRQVPAALPFVGYGHKISMAVVFKEASEMAELPRWLAEAKPDIELFHLQGCLSPQTLYVEGHSAAWEEWAKGFRRPPRILAFKKWGDVVSEIKACQPYVSAFGYAGPKSRIEELQPELLRLGFSRICALGHMQKPDLSWRNGGIFLPEFLYRINGRAYSSIG